VHLKHRHYSNQAQGASVFAFKNFFTAKRNKAKQNLFGMCFAPKSKKNKNKNVQLFFASNVLLQMKVNKKGIFLALFLFNKLLFCCIFTF